MKSGKIAAITMLASIVLMTLLAINVGEIEASLYKFHSYEELREFLQISSGYYQYYGSREPYALVQSEGARDALLESYSLGDFSQTNIQVEGVDEADVVKTDGEYIYAISGQTVFVVKAYPAEEAAVLSKISVAGSLKQMFINGERLIVFYENSSSWSETKTFIRIYDVSNKENPVQKREDSVDGNYFGSRMIGEYVYVVVNKAAWLENDGEVKLPEIYSEGEYLGIYATDVYYSAIGDSFYMFTTVVALNVQEDMEEPVYAPFLVGQTAGLYVSLENIYLAIGNGYKTAIHKIHVADGTIEYVADGQVPGTVLNQFSMDEHEGYFRIATLTWVNGAPNSNVYLLDTDLSTVGELTNIEPGETLDSARFIGNRCYLATSVVRRDPFFVIDVEDVANPKILGYLKIPGFTRYLHPYDESHIIGVGRDGNNRVKISIFDVTNVSAPVEIDMYAVQGAWSDTPVLSEHKAFLFAKSKNLLAIPVSINNGYTSTIKQWQGLYVFSVTSSHELTLRGNVTHQDDRVQFWDTNYWIKRALYINNVLYSVSSKRIKMNLLSDLSEIGTLELDA